MAKTMLYDAQLTRLIKRTGKFKGKKVTSHGAYRAKRKPNSPLVQRAERAKAASQFGKSAGVQVRVSTVLRQRCGYRQGMRTRVMHMVLETPEELQKN